MTVDETNPEAPATTHPVRRWRRRLKRAVITFFVLGAVLIGGLTYAFQVSGLEVNTPNGVNVILAREPFDGPPPATVRPTLARLEKLSHHNPHDFGFVGYDNDEERIVVNIATELGADLYEQQGVTGNVLVRPSSHSISELRQIMRAMFDEVDEFWGGAIDPVNNRIIASSSSLSPGLLGRIKDLYGTVAIAVWWEPLAGPPRLM